LVGQEKEDISFVSKTNCHPILEQYAVSETISSFSSLSGSRNPYKS